MALIYETATCVDVWLGEPGFVFPFSMNWLRRIWMHVDWEMGDRVTRKIFDVHAEAMDKAIGKSQPRWHDRAWIIQEYKKAKQICFYYGRYCTTHYDDYDPVAWKYTPDSKLLHLKLFTLRLSLYDELGHSEKSNGVGFFGGGIQAVAHCDATDPRDRVYSILGIATGKETTLVEPEYSVQPWQVFARATFASMTIRQDHEILQLVSIRRRLTEFMPSWAVDFVEVNKIIQPIKYDIYQVMYNVDPPSTGDYIKSLDDSNGTITVLGHGCCTVDKILNLDNDSFNIEGGSVIDPDDAPSSPISAAFAKVYEMFVRNAVGSAINAVGSIDNNEIRSTPCEKQILKKLVSDTMGVENVSPEQITTWLKYTSAGLELLPRADEYEDHPVYALLKTLSNWFFRTFACLDFTKTRYRILYEDELMQSIKLFGKYGIAVSGGCSLFSTTTGLVGIAPNSVAVRDSLVLGSGRRHPLLILRPDAGQYEFRGLALMHGLNMDPYPQTTVLMTLQIGQE